MQTSPLPLPAGDAVSLEAIFDALPGNAVLVKADAPAYTMLAATPNYLKQTGRTKESVIAKGTFEAFPGNDTDAANTGENALRASYQHVLVQKEPHFLPVQRYDLKAEDGSFSKHYWRASNSPVFGSDGEVAYIIHSAEDITHEIKAREQEEKMKGMEQAYNLFKQAPFAIHIFTGPDLVIELANAPTLELWGIQDDVVGKRFLDVLPELKDKGFDVLMHEVMQTGAPRFFYEVPIALNRPGREPIGYFNFIYQPYYKEGDTSAESVLIIANEVTQQALVRKQASESSQSLALAIEIAELGVFNIDLKTNVAAYSQQVMDWFGFEGPDLPMTTILTKVYPEDQPMVAETLERSIAGAWGGRHDFVYRVPHPKTGAVQYLRSIGQVLFEDGVPQRLSGIIQETTEQVTSRRRLEESEERFRNMIYSSPFAIGILMGPDLLITTGNDAIIEIWGKGKNIIGKPYFEVLPELAEQGYREIFDGVYSTGKAANFIETPVYILQKGTMTIKYYNFILYPQRNGAGGVEGIGIMASEVTPQAVQNKRIKESEERFRALVEEAPVAMLIFRGENMVINTANKMALQMIRRTEAIVGKPLLEAIPELTGSTAYQVFGEVYHTGQAQYGWEELVPLERAGVLEDRYFNFTYTPLIENGQVVGVMDVATEVTDLVLARKKIEEVVAQRTKELGEANQALQDANKELHRSNANLEEFAHAASHDLKEPVRKITFFAHQLKDQLTAHLTETELRSFGRIENATERMGNLIDDLLLYSHVSQRPHETEAVDLNEKIKRVLEDLELDIQEKEAIINVGKLPVVQGYRRQLQQLFQNLISNALKYSKAGVPPQIDVTAERREREGKSYHLIKVQDNGIGFAQEYEDKIFQMFARLHGRSEYSGTGVGLSIVKKVVENHYGFIQVQSAPEEGAAFSVLLPVE